MKLKSFLTLVIILFISLLLILKFIPINSQDAGVTLSLTVGPVIFGLFVAFSIFERLSRIDKIRDFDSTERSSIIMMSKVSKLWGMDQAKELHLLLDNYLIATLDFNIWDYHMTEPEFLAISDHVIGANKESGNEQASFVLDLLSKMLDARERTIGLISDRLSRFEWIVYIFLSIMVIIPFIIANSGTFFSILITLGLFVAVIFLLTFLYLIDSLQWKEETRIIEPYQKAFEAIGAKRYFPEILILKGRVKNSAIGEFRVGRTPDPYPVRTNKTIITHKSVSTNK